jgi:hypothetical protein
MSRDKTKNYNRSLTNLAAARSAIAVPTYLKSLISLSKHAARVSAFAEVDKVGHEVALLNDGGFQPLTQIARLSKGTFANVAEQCCALYRFVVGFPGHPVCRAPTRSRRERHFDLRPQSPPA